MRVLVADGSKNGGTARLARMIADGLSANGIDVDARAAPDVWTLKPFGAVIVVGGLDHDRWHRDARWFVHRYADHLRTLPVWLISGPLDDLDWAPLAPLPEVKRLAERIGARGCTSFGGRTEQVRGFVLAVVDELAAVTRRAS
jgi:menaquinone-dependent protoporphyrinogen oxidase